MEFGWGHIFILAKRMFHISDNKIAELLKVNRSTIYRHIKSPCYRFYPEVDVYKTLFAPSNSKSKTEQELYNILRISLNSDSFPTNFRSPQYESYQESIEYLLTKADETAMLAQKSPSLQAEGKLKFQETNEIDFGSEVELETQQLPELSEPMYYVEYCDMICSSMFDMYPGFQSSAPLDPVLKEQWETVRITDEFARNLKSYEILSFLAITPLDLSPMRKVGAKDTVVNHIRSAVRFVQHMEPAMDYMMISKENKEIFIDIANFVVLLRRYLDLLRENSNNSDLFAPEFIFIIPDDDKELEQKASKYYDELKSRLENLEKLLKSEDERRPDNGQ